jgi:hypothetical protein
MKQATMRKMLLRANAIFLLLASSWGLWADLAGAFFQFGPQTPILAAAPHAAIGCVEAHGLAFIIGVRLWFAAPERAWHFTAAAVHALLGVSNVVFWQIFIATGMLAGGYLATALHGAFFGLQMLAGITVPREPAVVRPG